jgi:NADPH:quinone reductase-like Zn-dependent oxidoreductase
METMKAVHIHHFGGPEVLRVEDLPVPKPTGSEILVKVLAAGLNPVDYKIREGKYPRIGADRLPLVGGRDLCGAVQACGADVKDITPGDEIYAFIGEDRGTHAEYTIVRSGEYAAKPVGLDARHAAAVPLAALTAWQGLFDHGGLKQGQLVLIHGGAGGVGHFAVQFAKAAGALVVTTASAGDMAFVAELGADQAIDYRAQRFEDLVADVDLVFDLIGGETQERSWSVLKRGGALISTLNEPSSETAAACGVRAGRFTAHPDGGQLSRITGLIEAGKVRPVLERSFELKDIRSAHHHLEHDHIRGKVVMTPGRRH